MGRLHAQGECCGLRCCAFALTREQEGKNRELRNVFEYGLRLQVSRLVRCRSHGCFCSGRLTCACRFASGSARMCCRAR